MFIFRALGALSLIAALGAACDGTLSTAAAQEGLSSMSCGDLWYRRNENLRPQWLLFQNRPGASRFQQPGVPLLCGRRCSDVTRRA